MGQFIKVKSQSSVPSGASWRGEGRAEVENGRGQYIEVGSQSKVPSGASWRSEGWAEVTKK